MDVKKQSEEAVSFCDELGELLNKYEAKIIGAMTFYLEQAQGETALRFRCYQLGGDLDVLTEIPHSFPPDMVPRRA